MTEHDDNPVEGIELRIPVEWKSADDLPTIYANQLLITHAGRQVYLVFGEAPVLLITGPEDPIPDTVYTRPVARIALTKESFVSFARAMQTNLERLLDKEPWLKEQIETGSEGE